MLAFGYFVRLYHGCIMITENSVRDRALFILMFSVELEAQKARPLHVKIPTYLHSVVLAERGHCRLLPANFSLE